MMKKQHGVTLIELMISMMLGLGLIAGIGQLFVQSQKSFRLQRNTSDMVDDASFILESLAKGVLLAGFADRPDPSLFPEDLNVLSVSGVPTINFSYGEIIHGTDTQLIFRYRLGNGIATGGGSQISDACSTTTRKGACELDNFVGTSALTGVKDELVTVRIYKKNDSDGIPVFYSKSQTTSANTAPKTDAQPLISEVEKLEFRYGIRIKCYENKITALCEKISNSATNGYKPQKDNFFYTTASNVDAIDADTSKNNWTNVFAVKVFLVMRSAEDNVVRTQNGYEIDGVPADPAPTDKRLYKTFSKTIFLRAPTQ
jgi:Tfp pilus assembly protein PilW